MVTGHHGSITKCLHFLQKNAINDFGSISCFRKFYPILKTNTYLVVLLSKRSHFSRNSCPTHGDLITASTSDSTWMDDHCKLRSFKIYLKWKSKITWHQRLWLKYYINSCFHDKFLKVLRFLVPTHWGNYHIHLTAPFWEISFSLNNFTLNWFDEKMWVVVNFQFFHTLSQKQNFSVDEILREINSGMANC